MADTPDLVELERALIVMLFCAPTPINLIWARPQHRLAQGRGTLDKQWSQLRLTDEANRFREKFLATVSPNQIAHFGEVAEAMKGAWPTEPHPDFDQINGIFNIVRTMKK
jgi:hypothetical protein